MINLISNCFCKYFLLAVCEGQCLLFSHLYSIRIFQLKPLTNWPLEITAVLLRIAPCYCRFITNYGSELITNYDKFITNYNKTLLQITAKNYCKLRQLY